MRLGALEDIYIQHSRVIATVIMLAPIQPTYFQCEVGPSGELFKGSTPESAGGPEDTEDNSVTEQGCVVGRGARVLSNIPIDIHLRRLKCVAYL